MGLSIFDKFGLSKWGDTWRTGGTIDLMPSGDLDDYIELSTTSNRPLISGAGNYLVLGKDATAGSATSADDILIGGKLEVDGATYLDAAVTLGSTLTLGGDVTGGGYDLNNIGHIGLGNQAADSGTAIYYDETYTIGDNNTRDGVYSRPRGYKTSADYTSILFAGRFIAEITNANTQNWTHSTGLIGVNSVITLVSGTAATKTITGAASLYAGLAIGAATNDMVLTNYYGLYVYPNTLVGNSKLTNDYGIYIGDQAGGSTINTGIHLAGANIGINFTGTYTSHIIDMSNATQAAGDVSFIRIGSYASPVDIDGTAQHGLVRIYGTTDDNGTSYNRGVFVCLKTEGTKGIFPVAGLAEVKDSGVGTGPNKVQAAQFIAHLNDTGAKLAGLGGDSTAGMYGAWLKITANDGATCSATARAAPVWLDNQLYGANAAAIGEEYTIFSTTGGSVPKAWAAFETSGAGWSQLFYFDETAYDQVPVSNTTLKALLDTTQYYIPLSTTNDAFTWAYPIVITDSTDASDVNTGSIITDGGVGIAKKLYVGTNLDVNGTTQLDGTLTVGIAGVGHDVLFYSDTSGSHLLWDSTTDMRLEFVNSSIQILDTRDKTATFNAIYSYIDTGGSTGWTSGNVVAGRFKVNSDGSGTIADMTAVWAGIIHAGTTSGVGLTCAINAEVTTTHTGSHPNAILYLQSLPGTSTSHATMPYIVFSETPTGTGSNILFEVGHQAAGTTCTTGAGTLYHNDTLQIKVNTGARYIPLSTVEGTYTTSRLIQSSLATDATTSTSGAVIIAGGVGIAKKLFVGTTLDVGTSIVNVGGQAYNDWTATTLNTSNTHNIRSASDDLAALIMYTYSTTAATASSIHLVRSNHDTVGSHGAVDANDVLGSIEFWASDGDSYAASSKIQGVPTETWSDSALGSKLEFYTVDDTTTTQDLRMTLENNAILTLAVDVACADADFTAVGDMTFTAGSILAAGSTNADTLILKGGGLSGTTFITITSDTTDTMVLGKTYFNDIGGEYIEGNGSNLTIAGGVIFPGTVYFYDAGGESISSNGSTLTIAGAVSFTGSTIVTADSASIEIGNGGIIKSGGTSSDTMILRADDVAFITFTTGATDECEIENATMKGTWLTDGTVTMPALTMGGLVTSSSTTGVLSTATFAPDNTYTNYAFAVGTEATELLVTFAQSNNQNLDLMQFNIDVDSAASGTGPTNSSQMNLIHGWITHDTDQMAYLRLKGMDMTITSAKNCKALYAYQGEIQLTATQTVTDEATVLGLVLNASGGTITAPVRGIVIAMNGNSMPSSNSMGILIATGSGADLYDGIYIETQGGTSIQNSIRLGSANGTTIACGLNIGGNGTFTNDISFQEGSTLTDDGTSLTLAGANFVGTMGALTLAGAVNCANQAMTNVDINSGAIDGVTIGAASAPTVTNLGTVTTCDINGGTIGGMTIDGNMTMGEVSLILDHAIGTDQNHSGITISGTAGMTIAEGEIVMLQTDDKWDKAQADSEANGYGMLGICLTGANDTQATTILLYGFMRDDTAYEFGNGGTPLYLSDTGAGDFITTKPDTQNDIVRIVGYAHDDVDTIFFNPDGAYVTIA